MMSHSMTGIMFAINKDTETDENGKVTIKYEDNIQNIVIKLTGIEKEGIVEFELYYIPVQSYMY